MKGILIQRDCLLRASGYDPLRLPGDMKLSESTLEALHDLAVTGLFIILMGRDTVPGGDESTEKPEKGIMRRLAGMISEGEGEVEVDALLVCSHPAEAGCACWGSQPGYLYEADAALDARLNECYVIGDSLLDVSMAYAGGCRPIFVLSERSIGQIFGDQPEHKDVPIAVDLKMAARYIAQEEEIAEQLGGPRAVTAPAMDTEFFEAARLLPEVVPLSARAKALQSGRRRAKLQPGEIRRLVASVVAGGVGLSLGIAYLLTHLYRQQHFPDWVWYATLQFVPRQVRGVLFIVLGLGILSLALWSAYQRMANGQSAKQVKRQP